MKLIKGVALEKKKKKHSRANKCIKIDECDEKGESGKVRAKQVFS